MKDNDVNQSPAFQEFLQKRRDEIVERDEICISLNREILNIERKLLPLLPKEALDKVLKIDELTMELINHICTLSADNFTTIPIIYR